MSRPRWERLDTLGGHVTYHNVFLAIYGVIQGARDIRGGEERWSLEQVLATGHARGAVVRDRAVGFTLCSRRRGSAGPADPLSGGHRGRLVPTQHRATSGVAW